MEKFYDNSEFSIFIDKENEIVDYFNKLNNERIRYLVKMIDKSIINAMSNETLLEAKQAIDIELNKRIDRGDFLND